MICQNCKKTVATVHLTEIEHGEKTEVHLCDECAKNQGMMASFSFGSLISDLAGTGDKPSSTDDPSSGSVEHATCEHCGMGYQEFRNAGRLGCAHDYDAFREGLAPLLERIHGATQHVGKVPARMGVSMAKEKDLIETRRELQKAIQREEYERAASLRDRIHALESEIGGGDDD